MVRLILILIFHLGLFGNLRPPLDISSHFSSAIIGLKSGFHLTLNFFFCSHQHEMLKIRYFFKYLWTGCCFTAKQFWVWAIWSAEAFLCGFYICFVSAWGIFPLQSPKKCLLGSVVVRVCCYTSLVVCPVMGWQPVRCTSHPVSAGNPLKCSGLKYKVSGKNKCLRVVLFQKFHQRK